MFDQLLAEIESDQNISDIVMSSGSFLAVRKNGQIIITSKRIDQSTIDVILQEIEKQS
jgi:Tfp pilus assembly pilus retraction ATPase PilT